MLRIILYLLAIALTTTVVVWFIEQPGLVMINFMNFELIFRPIQFVVSIGLIITLGLGAWFLIYYLVNSPNVISGHFKRRKQRHGLVALSNGLMALGIGDKTAATRFASQAKKSLPNDPLTSFLRAQTAHMTGDHVTAKRIYEAMLVSSDTELLGLRGLFLDAEHNNKPQDAFEYASQAIALNPRLQWPVTAVFDFQCYNKDWYGALKTLEIAKTYKHIATKTYQRKRAVLLTALAQSGLDENPVSNTEQALGFVLEATKLAPNLVPAAATAGHLLAAKGEISRASKILIRCWKQAPHPDIARRYAFVRPGDSPKDRLQRVKTLSKIPPQSKEGAIAIAFAAIEAKQWGEARSALEPFINGTPSARICALTARIESEQFGNKGRVREWLARALRAPKDPAWIADGYTSKHWQPTSPVTGILDAFVWKVPPETQASQDIPTVEGMTQEWLETVSKEQIEIAEHNNVEVKPENDAISLETKASEHVVKPQETKQTITKTAYQPRKQLNDKKQSKATKEPKKKNTSTTPLSSNKKDVAEQINIFTPSHAPDDPGPEQDNLDEQYSTQNHFHKV
ncbi:MAG: heme biosynthesis HemY N-terminal domain-containing protein [Pseudomonadota bacterium]